MIRLSTLLLAVLAPFLLWAQDDHHHEDDFVCGSQLYDQMLKQHPELLQKQESIDHKVSRLLDRSNPDNQIVQLRKNARSGQTITVVVHIIHDAFGNGDIPNTQVHDAIDHLNEAFANTGVYDQGDGVNTGIQFCLAQQDENGNFTTGITRTQSPLTNTTYGTAGDMALKSLIGWNQFEYLNIYVVNGFVGGPSGLAGYAYLPGAHGLFYDGIVMKADYMGSSTDDSKVLAHEAGHYLGLYHTWHNGCGNTNCLTSGDKVCDTPPDATNFPGSCSATANTCTTDVNLSDPNNPFTVDQNDLPNNYMDYTWLTCMHAFTQGQADRMMAVLTGTTTPATFPDGDVSWDRSSLLNSTACDNLCPNPITMSFTPGATTINIGSTLTFTNTSTISGVNNYSYSWQVDNVPFSTSSTSASYTFLSLGTFDVSLEAANGDPWCPDSTSTQITVVCPVTAGVTADVVMINPGDDVNFTGTASGPGTLTTQWYLDGVAITQPASFLYNFATAGTYTMQYVVSNGWCADTAAVVIQVGNCLNRRRSIWHFGNYAAIDFNGAMPVTATSNLSMDELEGCSSIADADGDLVLYTDGITAWNATGAVIAGATALGGYAGVTQDALIVPVPGSPSRYLVFANAPVVKELYVTEIDMSLSGGLGAVSVPTTVLNPHTFEKVTAVNHCDGESVWIISEDENWVYAYLLTTGGLNTTPVTSPTTGDPLFDYYGQMKASPDGRYLASARRTSFGIKLYDFDNTTGAATLHADIPTGDGYGVAFSSDATKLYSKPLVNDNLYQIDLSNPSVGAILASVTVIATLPTPLQNRRQMQLGPDGRVYITHNGFANLITVDNPNENVGTVTVSNSGFTLSTNLSRSGLPNLNQSYYYDYTPSIVGPDVVCEYTSGHIYTLPTTCATGETVVWSTIGDAYITTSNNQQAEVTVLDNGIAYLIAEKTTACGIVRSDTFEITIQDGTADGCPFDTCTIVGSFNYSFNPNCEVVFTNTSSSATGSTQISWFWDFGDGGSSTAMNPSYTYATPGFYNVCLVVTASNGLSTCLDSFCVNIEITCSPPCGVTADYSYDVNGCTVDFTDLSVPNPGNTMSGYLWTFGDGNFSNLANPSHTYLSPGTYNVCLIATSQNDSTKCHDTICYEIYVSCDSCNVKASFTYKMIDECTISLIENSSIGTGTTVLSWFWDFGDGNTSNLQSPTHTYASNGTYVVCLTMVGVNADGDLCSDTYCLTVNIEACEVQPCKLKVGFKHNVLGNCIRQFLGAAATGSGTTITGWFWSFGDGTTSTLQNPVHVYPSSGTYTVCLTVYATNGFVSCFKTVCQDIKVKGCVNEPCGVTTDFSKQNTGPCTVSFTDLSVPNPGSTVVGWLWDFGDGTTSTLQNPTHTFPSSGTYNVCLTTYVTGATQSCFQKVCKPIVPKGCLFVIGPKKRLSVSPNPSTGHFRLNLEQEIIRKEEVKAYNSYGQLVSFIWSGDGMEPTIDLSTHAAGLYWVSIQQGETLYRAKLILK